MKKLTILCDLDEIAACLLDKWLGEYNEDNNDNVTVSKLTSYKIHAHVKIGEDIYKYIDKDEFFSDLKPMPGAVDALTSLANDGHNVVFASAHFNADSAKSKIKWVKKHFGFSHDKVILIHQKFMLRGDVFIDDSPHKIKDYREAWPHAQILTISYPFNQSVRGIVDLMADDYANPVAAWASILTYIRELSKT